VPWCGTRRPSNLFRTAQRAARRINYRAVVSVKRRVPILENGGRVLASLLLLARVGTYGSLLLLALQVNLSFYSAER